MRARTIEMTMRERESVRVGEWGRDVREKKVLAALNRIQILGFNKAQEPNLYVSKDIWVKMQ